MILALKAQIVVDCGAYSLWPLTASVTGMVYDSGSFVLGVVGGIMQPQGQVQVLSRLVRGEPVQAAVDAPRFRLLGDGHVALEDGLPDGAAAALAVVGYRPRGSKQVDFGGGHAIFRDLRGNLSAGTDRRKDGTAATLTLS